GVGDDEFAHTELGQGEPDRTAGSAGADLHNRLGGGSCQSGSEPGGESGDIGVVTGRAPLPVDDDGVDRIDASGHRVDVVEEVDDLLFERVGDVETVEAETDRRVQQLVQRRP